MIDVDSPPGSWRRELLARPLTVTECRQMISELEHALRVSRANFDRLRETNLDLVKRLSEAVAREMEQRAVVVKLEDELERWSQRRTG